MNKIAIVTGAASGFGYEFSKLLAEDSYNLLLIDINGPGLEEVKRELQRKYSVSVDILQEINLEIIWKSYGYLITFRKPK